MNCLDHFLDWLNTNSGAITAIATGVIAWFTVSLATVSRRQAELISDQIQLARDEFNATHRPKIIVRGFFMMKPDLPPGEPVRFGFVAHNIGETPGTIVEISTAATVLQADDQVPQNSGIPGPKTLNLTLASGQHEVLPTGDGYTITDSDAIEIGAGNSVLLCVGVVIYVDGAKIRRQTGFSRRYRPRGRVWDIVESEYEYAY